MIRYDVKLSAVEAAVNAREPKWLGKAQKRTERFVTEKRYDEASPMWSDVKPVFMAIQQNKCAFCEQQHESELYGKIEFDLEHFRPKSSVTAWPKAGVHDYHYDFATGDHNPAGYYWLPYKLENYAASCKVCNSRLKSNYFPVGGTRITEPGDLAGEMAFLCYPIGDTDADPETLVGFVATTAVPLGSSALERRRGQVIIDFFDLNRREDLHRQRAHMIMTLGGSLMNIENGLGDAIDDEIIARMVEPVYPHTACVRAYRRLWDEDKPFAKKVLKACRAYFVSERGSPPPQP